MSDLQFKLKHAFYPTPFKNSDTPPYLPGFVFSKNYGIPDPEIEKPDQLGGISVSYTHLTLPTIYSV